MKLVRRRASREVCACMYTRICFIKNQSRGLRNRVLIDIDDPSARWGLVLVLFLVNLRVRNRAQAPVVKVRDWVEIARKVGDNAEVEARVVGLVLVGDDDGVVRDCAVSEIHDLVGQAFDVVEIQAVTVRRATGHKRRELGRLHVVRRDELGLGLHLQLDGLGLLCQFAHLVCELPHLASVLLADQADLDELGVAHGFGGFRHWGVVG